jgi:hypothetical protein
LKHLCDSRGLISFTALTHQGAPIVKVRRESLFVFDGDLKSWTVLSGHTTDEMKENDRLDHRKLNFPSGSPFLVDSALVLAANKPDLLGCFVDHVKFLRDHNRFQIVDELCHELWTGSGWMFAPRSYSLCVVRLVVLNKTNLLLLCLFSTEVIGIAIIYWPPRTLNFRKWNELNSCTKSSKFSVSIFLLFHHSIFLLHLYEEI